MWDAFDVFYCCWFGHGRRKDNTVLVSGGGLDLGSSSGMWALTRGVDEEG
jgi:hypothetical protein